MKKKNYTTIICLTTITIACILYNQTNWIWLWIFYGIYKTG